MLKRFSFSEKSFEGWDGGFREFGFKHRIFRVPSISSSPLISIDLELFLPLSFSSHLHTHRPTHPLYIISPLFAATMTGPELPVDASPADEMLSQIYIIQHELDRVSIPPVLNEEAAWKDPAFDPKVRYSPLLPATPC